MGKFKMSIFGKIFNRIFQSEREEACQIKSSGEMITETMGGANLVDGKQTWEYAEEKKHDIECMKKCCEAELRTMEKAGLVPAPYYFERVAILSRKEKNYQQEIHYCELYINTIENFYRKRRAGDIYDVRNGPRYKAIASRLPKAKELLAKAIKNT